MSIKPACTKKCWIKNVWPISGCYINDLLTVRATLRAGSIFILDGIIRIIVDDIVLFKSVTNGYKKQLDVIRSVLCVILLDAFLYVRPDTRNVYTHPNHV